MLDSLLDIDARRPNTDQLILLVTERTEQVTDIRREEQREREDGSVKTVL